MKVSALRRQMTTFHVPVSHRRQRSIGKDLIAGVVGGMVGTIVMTQFQNAWSEASNALKQNGPRQELQGKKQRQREHENEDATMKAAGKIAQIVAHQLSHDEKKKFGPVVHYGFGTTKGRCME